MDRSSLTRTRVMAKSEVREVEPPTSQSPHGCLVFIAGDRIGRKLELREGDLVLGRDPASDVMINSDLVSRQHAKFVTSGDSTLLLDLDSTNGTYVNDERVKQRALADGDRVAIGKVVMKYLAAGNAEAGFHDEVFRLVSHDGLTDVYNKRYFDEHLAAATSPGQGVVSVIVFDADHFKAVNDTHGHAAGDSVLRQIADCARRSVPDTVALARVGGEEFAVLAGGLDLAQVAVIAEAIRATVQGHEFRFGKLVIPMTVSVGVAERASGSAESGQDLFRRADAQLYRAKQSGRNRVCS
jgi:two-component system, cell cycle response regulator